MKRYLILLAIVAAGCVTIKNNQLVSDNNPDYMVGGKLYTAVWMQRAAEYKALCEQAYNIATLRIQQYSKRPTSTKPTAIITDIDETFLDNSPYAVHQALQNKDYSDATWKDWTARASADTLSGALAFFNYAASKGVTVFYITNRGEDERKGTLANLKKFGFPNADDAHLILKTNTSSKESRRNAIEQNYHVVLLLGDNLGDFSSLFDHKSEGERMENVLNNKADFGKKFIVLPNPNYGDWESAMFQYNYKLSNYQKDSILKNKAKNY